MKFIHTADIHLDSPLTGLAADADAPAELLRTATREAFTRLIDAAIAEPVDFLVIAGDLYDGNWRDFNTGVFFVRQMGRLRQAGIPAYLLYGNHDAENEMTRKLALPDNVFVFGTRKASSFTIPALQVALHGRSFKEAATTENLVLGYPAPVPGWLNIGVLHTALEGNAAHATYAPCALAELHAKGYQYWALGHVHEYQLWREPSTVVFPGNLQGRHIREPGPRGAVLVTAEGNEITAVDRLCVDVVRWHLLEVDVGGAVNFAEAVRLAGRRLEQLAEAGEAGIPVAVRVRLSGATAAHGELFGLELQLRSELRAQAAALGDGRIWIEKVKIETTALESPQQIAARSDAIADLQQLLAGAVDDPELLSSLQEDLQLLIGKLPHEVLQALPQLDDIRAGQLGDLVRSTAPGLLAYLAKAE